MPTLTRWFIKSGLVCLVAAFGAGVAMAAAPELPRWPVLLVLGPTWIHLLVVGWLSQLIFGVAYWMFPRQSAESPRGSDRLGWVTFFLLNLGLLLRVLGEPLVSLGAGGGGLLIASALLQFGAALGFIFNTWPRIKGR